MSAARLRALLIDDERLARDELRRLLSDCPAIEICGEAANRREALEQGRLQSPDVVFLDVEMPGGSGFDLLDQWPEPKPAAIFTTAFPEFAARSYEFNGVDYLLKPIAPDRLAQAIRRLGQSRAEADLSAVAADESVLLQDGERCWLVPVRSIRRVQAEGNYARVFFDDQSIILSRTLASLESRLPSVLFLRANRSELINLGWVGRVEPWFSGCLRVELRGGDWVELSRRQSQLFRARRSL